MNERYEREKSSNACLITVVRALLFILFITTTLFATVSGSRAAGPLTKLIIFPDKKVYTHVYNDPGSTDADSPDGLKPIPNNKSVTVPALADDRSNSDTNGNCNSFDDLKKYTVQSEKRGVSL